MAWATGTMSVVTNASLVKQARFQRELVPVSVVLGNALHYALQLALLLIAVGIVVGVNVQWLWLPVVLVMRRILLYAEPPGATLLKLAVGSIIAVCVAVWVGYMVFARALLSG